MSMYACTYANSAKRGTVGTGPSVEQKATAVTAASAAVDCSRCTVSSSRGVDPCASAADPAYCRQLAAECAKAKCPITKQ